MGCVCAKLAPSRNISPRLHSEFASSGTKKLGTPTKETLKKDSDQCFRSRELKKTKKGSVNSRSSLSKRLGFSHRFTDAEAIAAGWPPWLSTNATEAIQGWIPLKTESFEKLEKIGQGTYSSVFRARELETGRIVALKKVRFDRSEPDSIRFMSREITILRRLNHPNVLKLEGIITSRLSSSIFLVFEYMDHDLCGLTLSPAIKFTEPQVKCYMKQLLSGLEHCHQRGVMHRDIKTSNIFVNNEGVLKLGDFGLANMSSSKRLTSHVVTLWYRAPELLMGSTTYGSSVDLWSVGCVFAELILRKPLFKGRTEVEQLHKIFKLCGSPTNDFWKTSKIPQATMFKPQQFYESSLHERFRSLPHSSVSLISTFLSVEPYNRGTASSALSSEYFRTLPDACEPCSLPKYHPNKEIDAKNRDALERCRNKARSRTREQDPIKNTTRIRRPLHEQMNSRSLIPTTDVNGRGGINGDPGKRLSISAISAVADSSCQAEESIISVPIPPSSSGFECGKRRKDNGIAGKSFHRTSLSQVIVVD